MQEFESLEATNSVKSIARTMKPIQYPCKYVIDIKDLAIFGKRINIVVTPNKYDTSI